MSRLVSMLLFMALLISLGARAGAQETTVPVTVGLTLSLGDGTHATGVAGVFAEYNRWRISPGLDVRGNASSNGLTGTLVGPRASFRVADTHFYTEVLAGPNYISFADPGTYDYRAHYGVTTQVVAGIDLECGQHLRWRVAEYTHSWFTGAENSQQNTVTSGIVLRFP